MGLLDGSVQSIVGNAARFLMLDVTIHKPADGTFDPSTGNMTSDSFTDTAVSRAGFPDSSSSMYRGDSLLEADERLVVLLQKPLVDAGVTVAKGDEITIRSQRSRVLDVFEDPAQATLELRVKP